MIIKLFEQIQDRIKVYVEKSLKKKRCIDLNPECMVIYGIFSWHPRRNQNEKAQTFVIKNGSTVMSEKFSNYTMKPCTYVKKNTLYIYRWSYNNWIRNYFKLEHAHKKYIIIILYNIDDENIKQYMLYF